MHIYDSISLNSSENEKCFRHNLRGKSKYISPSVTFIPKSCLLQDNNEEQGKPDRPHMTI